MSVDRDQTIQAILDFIELIYECHASTKFTEDRAMYAQDLIEAVGWLIRLRQGDEIANVTEEILSAQTAKHFGDYWRQGTWGDIEAAGLRKLKERLT